MGRERNEQGQYIEKITLDDILAVFENNDAAVLTATDVSEELECSRPSAYNKLEKLADQGELQKKDVGARAVVYIDL